jgi:DICT domain-containing protein/nitrogen-specific signal transduction histidine kinase
MMNQSLLDDLVAAMPQIRLQMYFKSSLIALSHAMEDQVLASQESPLVIASFQRERFYRQEAHRYLRISQQSNQVYVLAAPESDFCHSSGPYETIAFDAQDAIAKEWHLVVLGENYGGCIVCKEVKPETAKKLPELHEDQARRFEGLWTFDRQIVFKVAELLLQRIVQYRPELAAKASQGLLSRNGPPPATPPDPFVERLVTYLQVGQYKLDKAYRHMAAIQAEAYSNLKEHHQQLEALDRTRSNLIAITGHELRTPLSTIQVCLESLATDPSIDQMQQIMVQTALADADRMRKLIQDFLTLSRLESGRMEWAPEPQSLPDAIDLAMGSLRTRYGPALPKIRSTLKADLPSVMVDGEWLIEVLTKLLDNACKFTTPQGRITINGQLGDRPQTIEVIIADTGRGIETDRLETVFERFYQEEGALRRSAGGTGLGLAICRQVITAWGGTIWATSKGKNKGSQFHFTLPISDRTLPQTPVELGSKA